MSVSSSATIYIHTTTHILHPITRTHPDRKSTRSSTSSSPGARLPPSRPTPTPPAPAPTEMMRLRSIWYAMCVI